ncbi:MAG: hypothetical protein MPK01_06695 [Gammaproteobacteria bacterium]|nr:hypothetical protein [Gammaproteobacteria bacterium]MDA8024431.1 hypothetical protein [Gammaproteobacteria bacterium]
MPDFAGVALVDILANGVAMLIIVIVVSIAARVEREERYAEQADEIASVMSHKFSTSLVLNSLAASPPAVLHDYEHSAIDQILDPQVMPIIELHPDFVREYYSGARWPRRELLSEFNGMHAWLLSLNELQKRRIRTDIYDVGQYYLAMSILREHGVRVTHWHFLTGPLSLADAANCPPGVAAKDCRGRAGDTDAPPPALAGAGGGTPGAGAGQSGGELSASEWPPVGAGGDGDNDGEGTGGGGDSPGPIPEGAVPGFAANGILGGGGGSGDAQNGGGGGGGENNAGAGNNPGGGLSSAELGSFPGTESGSGGGGGAGTQGGRGGGQSQQNRGSEDSIQFRLALPESIRSAAGLGAAGVPPLDLMFAALLHYLGELQDTLDAGYSPSAYIADFGAQLQRAFSAPPQLSADERELARELAVQRAFLRLNQTPAANTIAVEPLAGNSDSDDALLVIPPNRLLEKVAVRGPGEIPDQSRITLRLNAFPGIWKGLDVRIEPNALLLMPPNPRAPRQLRWRALAYLSPRMDEVVVGFAHADIGEQNDLRIRADAGGVRLGNHALFSKYAESPFGARGWLVTLYAALVAGLLALLLARRRFARPA